jgi:signal transduction histidine kinase/DNA-binding response OmpR family regulator
MRRFSDLSIQRKLTVLAMATTLLALTLAAGAFLAYDVISYRQKMVEDLRTLTRTLEANTINGLVFNDRETTTMILQGLEVHPYVVDAAVYDSEGALFAELDRQGDGPDPLWTDLGPSGHAFRDDHLLMQLPMEFNGRSVGTFQVRSSLDALGQRMRAYLRILLLVLVVVSALAFLFARGLQNVISGPIRNLDHIVRRVREEGDYSLRAPAAGGDEVGRLVGGVNGMLEQIQQRDEELMVARDRAEQANRTKSVFLANMSHELRTPLTAIIGYSEILEDDARELGLDDFLPDLQKIQAAGKHLLGLINSILDLSKVEAGKMELYLESFELPRLVAEVASTVNPLVEKRRNTLEIRCSDDTGSIVADQTKTRQILFNLLSNASKFTEEGRVLLEVRPLAAGGLDGYLFRVRDTGIGMTDEQLARLFKPFAQADASTARNFGGTGLGLALCKRFCELMGGRIDVVSEYGKGTTFTVWLPAEVHDKKARPVHQLLESGEWRNLTSKGRSTHMPTPAAGASLDGKLVLVIDDDLAVHDLLGDMLRKEGFRIASATSGPEGLAKARDLKPDIITLDVYMPEKDGWSVLAEIKADARLAGTPVIMISVSDQRQKGYALGAEYLTKPIDRGQLATLLAKYRGDEEQPLGLVIDDDAELRRVVRRFLEEEGWTVMEAENGIAGLRRVAEAEPNLILLDLMMPQLDGFGFLEQVRKNDSWRRIPTVVLTAMDLGPEERSRLNGGVEKVLQKGAMDLEQMQREILSLARSSLHG